ncbi:tetratricopeptide repeat protein [Erythrobacter sp. SDW2]|uniref:tetratricopeptide repeat protein n=1 Tax=Erythrobacter sp. SDW2 TaxID=2907154 RepID=UPI001F2C4FA9|nr:tetratricopeptide repeat protein [Erythrobacter sp. SDW2]UIP07811.1 tetratricopeptide repeat protein [Erythrobacter sp. SDW2]
MAQDVAAAEDIAAAQSAFASGDFDRAKVILQELLLASPKDADLWRRLAAVEAAAGDLLAAQQTIDRALQLAPDDPDVQLGRANILLWRGKLTEAQAQAAVVAQKRPDYPGLAEFAAAAAARDASRQLRIRSVSAGTTVSRADFSLAEGVTWTAQQAALGVGWGENSRATLEIEREDRGLIDTRVAGRLDFAAGPHRVFLTGSITPDADFRESWSLGTGAEVGLTDGTELLLGLRYADYRFDDVAIVRLGLRQRVTPWLSVTGETIQLFGGGEDYRLGGSLRADLSPINAPSFFIIAASYPDAEVDGTRQLRSLAAGTAIPLGDGFSLRLAGEYEDRKDSYERVGANIGLVWSFGG